jgi:translation elongation factor EF-Ts
MAKTQLQTKMTDKTAQRVRMHIAGTNKSIYRTFNNTRITTILNGLRIIKQDKKTNDYEKKAIQRLITGYIRQL